MFYLTKNKSCKKRITTCLYMLFFVFPFLAGYDGKKAAQAHGSEEMRACWISYIDIQSLLCDLDEESFRTKVSDMYDRVIFNNMNTVIVQVRPMGDAIYPSDYFPWSVYISGNRKNPGYDPLSVMIELAHKKGLRFEAWVNPYRLSHNDTTTKSFKATKYYELFQRYTIEYENAAGHTCLSLDPSKEESVQLILCGVCEIVNNYEVDGIHFDDYFYVPGMADGLSQNEKMEHVNNLISKVYYNIKCINPNVSFGISPAGNLSYTKSQGTDIETWLSNEGYVDYIMPQIYWTDFYVAGDELDTMFSNRCEEWGRLNKIGIPMYAGLALYRVGEESEADLGWMTYDNNLATQYGKALSYGYKGYALFRYMWLEYDVAADELKNLNMYVRLDIAHCVGMLAPVPAPVPD
ncbi:MAG: family 10 glycosylhydrolase [Clostridium sp.]|nr:family 10 glycosylhydrolase [Clostridium sp.]MCM1397968.1 family 10 glycosylhydrolase [Clostridium sp.]MCM1459396.1 family 10 glycosylhydrolase [Bacteroides sp.]